MNFDTRLFVDSGVEKPLPPIYKGKLKKFYPGQMMKNTRKDRIWEISSSNTAGDQKRTGLRRYVFRYENGKFIYLATRKGQRNGGFNSRPSQTSLLFQYSGPQINSSATFALSATPTEDIYVESGNSIIKYDQAETRWEWTTRPSLTSGFFLQAFSSSTSNTLRNSGAANEVSWTYINDPWVTATPQVPIVVTITPSQWYNNNSVENLNKWPIQNYDANYTLQDPSQKRPWQIKNDDGSAIIPDNRIDALSDDFLNRCFEGVKLKPYDIVFVEVVWKLRMNKSDFQVDLNTPSNQPPTYRSASWGYWDRIHNYEWWSPKPFYGRSQKGRVYRIGILEADMGVGGYDKILWAQRTRLITTERTRGGRTALE
jgi:hypothetical protein